MDLTGEDRRFDAAIFGGANRVGDFTKLAVWKKAHELTVGVYRRSSECRGTSSLD